MKINRRMVGWAITLTTAILNWYIFQWFGGVIEHRDPAFFAWILLLSVLIHEAGHALVMESNGIMTHIVFAVILGGAVADPKDEKKFASLPWSNQAGIMLAGVTGNLIFVLGSIGAYKFDVLSGQEMMEIIDMNGGLIALNLLPFGIFDGGRFSKLLFDSIPENRDETIAKAMVFGIATLSVLWFAIYGKGGMTTIGLLYYGMHKKAAEDDPRGSRNPLAMTTYQYKAWALAYVLLFGFGTLAEIIASR